MKKIELTGEQREKVMNALAEIHDEDGRFDIDIELDTITINAQGCIEIDGYIEDDYHCGYMNGTGAFVETYRAASVDLTAYDEDGNEYEIDKESNNIIDKYLNAA